MHQLRVWPTLYEDHFTNSWKSNIEDLCLWLSSYCWPLAQSCQHKLSLLEAPSAPSDKWDAEIMKKWRIRSLASEKLYFCRVFSWFVIVFQDWHTNRFKCALIYLCNLSTSGSGGHSLNYLLWWEFYHIEPDAASHEICYCAWPELS